MGDRVAYVVPNKRRYHVQGGALHMGGAARTNVLQEAGHLYRRRSSAQVDFLDTFLNHRLYEEGSRDHQQHAIQVAKDLPPFTLTSVMT